MKWAFKHMQNIIIEDDCVTMYCMCAQHMASGGYSLRKFHVTNDSNEFYDVLVCLSRTSYYVSVHAIIRLSI